MQKSTTAPEGAIAVVGDGGNLIARFATGFSENKLTALISVRRTEQTAILEVSEVSIWRTHRRCAESVIWRRLLTSLLPGSRLLSDV